jgi:hypothetical protein
LTWVKVRRRHAAVVFTTSIPVNGADSGELESLGYLIFGLAPLRFRRVAAAAVA